MDSATNNLINNLSPHLVLEEFFHANTPESARNILWYIFKAWVYSPPANRTQYSDEEIASFLDQLIDLVAAAYTLHQANEVTQTPQEGQRHD